METAVSLFHEKLQKVIANNRSLCRHYKVSPKFNLQNSWLVVTVLACHAILNTNKQYSFLNLFLRKYQWWRFHTLPKQSILSLSYSCIRNFILMCTLNCLSCNQCLFLLPSMPVGHTKQFIYLILALLCFYIFITEYAESWFNLTKHFMLQILWENTIYLCCQHYFQYFNFSN